MKEEFSPQTKRQPVRASKRTALAQDIVETPSETYKGLICDPSSLRIKLGELEPSRLKDLDNAVVMQGGVKRWVQAISCCHWWVRKLIFWRACCSHWWARKRSRLDDNLG
jgi:hypothetical protein